MKTKHILVALGTLVLMGIAATASVLSVPPKPCAGYIEPSGQSPYQQGDAMTQYLSKYDGFANLRLSGKGYWVVSWRGQVPENAQHLVEKTLEPKSVVTRDVPFNKAELDAASKSINLELDTLKNQGLVKSDIVALQLDAQSYKVLINLNDPSNEADVIRQLKKSTNVPVVVEVTDSEIIDMPPTVRVPGCPIAL